ncbi:serine/threonine protein kinase [Succinimonas sp.]|uniref:serine/threonine protein kinase n=1 Tax=Succinimonas sp. TaxID=1936151 RepID=UPI003869E34D
METKINSRSASAKQTRVREDDETTPDITEAVLDDGFRVVKRLNFRSGEADIYECSRNSREKLLLKYYRRTAAIKESVLRKLKDIRNPCVAPVYAAGVYEEHQYVIMPWYEKRSLADELEAGTTFSLKDLKNRIIPSVNEALRAIHDAGIIHKDLKPSNLIPDDAGKRIVVIDFGISSDTDGRTLVRTSTGMTPLYAAPEAVQGFYHRASDYYSLGITVFELFTGHPPFQNTGLSPEESARLAAVNKISFPDNFPKELRDLVLGLTYRDISGRNESNNPNRRWGYQEVSAWLKGQKQPVPGEYVSEAENVPPSFPPYPFNGRKYTDSGTFIRALLANPDKGIRELGRGIISHHYSLYDEQRAAMARQSETELEKAKGQEYGIFCSLMYHLEPSVRELYADGRPFQSMNELAKALLLAVNQATGSRLINHAVSLLSTGFLDYYAAQIVKSRTVEEILARIKKLIRGRTFSEKELAYLLGWFFSQERSFRAGNRVFQSPEDFGAKMKRLSERTPTEYLNYIASAKQELLFVGEFIPDRNASSYIKKALNAKPDITKTAAKVPVMNKPMEGNVSAEGRNSGIPWGVATFFMLIIAIVVYHRYWKLSPMENSTVLPQYHASGTESASEQYLSRGLSLEKQNEKALALMYFVKACKSNIVDGCTKAGWYYQNGIGIPGADYTSVASQSFLMLNVLGTK